jgi:basic amino acid/polyamine antiporter, APA family
VTDPGVTAMLAAGLARYVGYFARLSLWEMKATAVAAIIALATVNMVGISLSSGVLRVLAALKLGLLGFLVVWGFSLGRGDWANLSPFWTQRPGSDPLLQALTVGLISSFISFGGWWDASKLAGEMRDPSRTLPRSLVLGVSLVTLAYIAISGVFLYLVRPERIGSDEAFAALAGEALFGAPGGKIFAAVVIVSVLGSLAAILMASPRVYYAMARDGLFFPAFAVVDPSRGTPARAVAIQAVLATVLALTGTFEEILAFLLVPTLGFLALSVAAVFVLRRGRNASAPLVTPGYPLSPLVFFVPVVALIILVTLRNPLRAAIGLLVVLVGVLVSGWVVAHSQKAGDDHSSQEADADSAPPSTSHDAAGVTPISVNS